MSDSGHVEIHESDDWSAVYLDGDLVRVGDTYLADEWVREHFGVVTVQDDAYLMGGNGRDGVATTLDKLHAYQNARQERRERAAAMRAEAKRLEAEAAEVEKGL